MEGRIQQLEARLAEVEQAYLGMIQKVMPVVLGRIEKLEGQAHSVPAPPVQTTAQAPVTKGESKRIKTTYPEYKQVMALLESGLSTKDVAAQLGRPYSTIINYTKWTPDKVAKKKVQWDQEGGAKSSKQDTQPQTAEVVDQVTGEVTTPAEEGWQLWTAEHREYAGANKRAQLPTLPAGLKNEDVVVCEYENGFTCVTMAVFYEWEDRGSSPNIVRWRMATPEEVKAFKEKTKG